MERGIEQERKRERERYKEKERIERSAICKYDDFSIINHWPGDRGLPTVKKNATKKSLVHACKNLPKTSQ